MYCTSPAVLMVSQFLGEGSGESGGPWVGDRMVSYEEMETDIRMAVQLVV